MIRRIQYPQKAEPLRAIAPPGPENWCRQPTMRVVVGWALIPVGVFAPPAPIPIVSDWSSTAPRMPVRRPPQQTSGVNPVFVEPPPPSVERDWYDQHAQPVTRPRPQQTSGFTPILGITLPVADWIIAPASLPRGKPQQTSGANPLRGITLPVADWTPQPQPLPRPRPQQTDGCDPVEKPWRLTLEWIPLPPRSPVARPPQQTSGFNPILGIRLPVTEWVSQLVLPPPPRPQQPATAYPIQPPPAAPDPIDLDWLVQQQPPSPRPRPQQTSGFLPLRQLAAPPPPVTLDWLVPAEQPRRRPAPQQTSGAISVPTNPLPVHIEPALPDALSRVRQPQQTFGSVLVERDARTPDDWFSAAVLPQRPAARPGPSLIFVPITAAPDGPTPASIRRVTITSLLDFAAVAIVSSDAGVNPAASLLSFAAVTIANRDAGVSVTSNLTFERVRIETT